MNPPRVIPKNSDTKETRIISNIDLIHRITDNAIIEVMIVTIIPVNKKTVE
jgi:hypothetical protein